MQAIHLKQPGGLDNLTLAEIDAMDPVAGEVRVRIHASSLKFHDYAVAIGMIPVEQDRSALLFDSMARLKDYQL